jgi:hypothetical protein
MESDMKPEERYFVDAKGQKGLYRVALYKRALLNVFVTGGRVSFDRSLDGILTCVDSRQQYMFSIRLNAHEA